MRLTADFIKHEQKQQTSNLPLPGSNNSKAWLAEQQPSSQVQLRDHPRNRERDYCSFLAESNGNSNHINNNNNNNANAKYPGTATTTAAAITMAATISLSLATSSMSSTSAVSSLVTLRDKESSSHNSNSNNNNNNNSNSHYSHHHHNSISQNLTFSGLGIKDLPTPTSTPTASRKSRRRSNLFIPSSSSLSSASKKCEKDLKNGELGSGRAIPLKQGYLYKRSSKSLNKEWKKKYVTLCDDGRLTYHPSLHDYMDDVHGKEISLQYVTVKVPGQKPRGSKSIVTNSVLSTVSSSLLPSNGSHGGGGK